jgi:iodothyronine deiodinase-like protein
VFGSGSYNYEHFSRNLLVDMKKLSGPEPGDVAPDFALRTVDGDKLSLSDFEEHKNVLLAFGSATCPLTLSSIGGLNHLYEKYRGDELEFLFVYIREAHPGEELPAHESMVDKFRAAQLFRDEEGVTMPVLVDDLRGSVHRKYGKLPNPSYLIDKSGRIAFRCLYAQPAVLEKAINELLEFQTRTGKDHAMVAGGEDRRMPKSFPLLHTYRALKRGGREAIQNFEEALGIPGKMAVAGSRIVQPVVENPGKTAAAAALTAGVLAGGIYAGFKLREKRFAHREPYRYFDREQRRRTGTDDYEPIGI